MGNIFNRDATRSNISAQGINTETGEDVIMDIRDIKLGRELRIIVIIMIIFSIVSTIASAIGAAKIKKDTINYYFFVGGSILSALMFIVLIIFLRTTVRSLMVEDIIAQSFQRISAGTESVGKFQEATGAYLKQRLFTIDSGVTNKEAARQFGRSLNRQLN